MSVKTEERNTISSINTQVDSVGNVDIQLGYEKGAIKYFLICERYKEKTWEEDFDLSKYIEEHQQEVEAVFNTNSAHMEENLVIRQMGEVASTLIKGITQGYRPYICELFAVEKQQDCYIVHIQNDGNNSVTLKAEFVCEDHLIQKKIKTGLFSKEDKTSRGILLDRERENAGHEYKDGAVEYSADTGRTWIPLTAKCIGRELEINVENKIDFRVYDKYKSLFDIREV